MIAAGACSKCGLEHQRCHAHVHRPDEGGTRPCGAHPIRGATVCGKHGGKSPQVQRKAAQVLAEREAVAQAQAAYPRRRPSEILLDALHKADALAQQAAVEGWPDAAAHQAKAEQLAQVVLNKDLEAVEAGLTEEQGVALAGVLRHVLDRLELTAEQQQLVPVVVPEELRAAAVPSGTTLHLAVQALTAGLDVHLAEAQAAIVVHAWRRAVSVLQVADRELEERAARVFVEECRRGAAEQVPGVEDGAERAELGA